MVPDVVGQNVEEAKAKLAESTLNATVVGSADVTNLPPNQQYVIITDPPAGSPVNRKSTVKLYVGTKEDYQNGGTPTPTPPQAVIDVKMVGTGTVTGGGTYELNTQVTLTATPAAGYVFDCWLDSLGNQLAISNTYTFVVTGSTEYTAVFAPLPTDTPVPTSTNTPVPTLTNTPATTSDPNQGGNGDDQNQGQGQGQGGNPG